MRLLYCSLLLAGVALAQSLAGNYGNRELKIAASVASPNRTAAAITTAAIARTAEADLDSLS